MPPSALAATLQIFKATPRDACRATQFSVPRMWPGFTSPKESSQLQQLQNAPKGTAGAFLMDSPATPHFPPTGAKTDTNFYRARPTSKDTRHITSANDDRCRDRRHSYVPSTRWSTRDNPTRDVVQPSISLPRLHGRVTTSLTHKSQTWTSLKDDRALQYSPPPRPAVPSTMHSFHHRPSACSGLVGNGRTAFSLRVFDASGLEVDPFR